MRSLVNKARFSILLLALLLGACASQVPLNIRNAPADSPSLAQVRENTAASSKPQTGNTPPG
jgi:starvation-inducible outer membrane lipoprotein